jgi:YD repeat-containing protein
MTSDGKRTFIYDADDRLVEVKEGTTSLGKYQYNSEGLHVSKTTESTTVYYTYDENDNVVLETHSTDSTGTVQYSIDPFSLAYVGILSIKFRITFIQFITKNYVSRSA